MKLVLASSNRGKLEELRELLADTNLELVAQSDLGIADVEESGLSFVENAILKARHASRAGGMAALGDDSGLCVDVLNGAPGLYSARYAGEHGNSKENIDKLLHELDNRIDDERNAHFVCVLALLHSADDPDPLIATGRWRGRILTAPRGNGGFGYDPVFLPDGGGGQSAAEIAPTLKNRISHRGMALAELQRKLKTLATP